MSSPFDQQTAGMTIGFRKISIVVYAFFFLAMNRSASISRGPAPFAQQGSTPFGRPNCKHLFLKNHLESKFTPRDVVGSGNNGFGNRPGPSPSVSYGNPSNTSLNRGPSASVSYGNPNNASLNRGPSASVSQGNAGGGNKPKSMFLVSFVIVSNALTLF